jgi:hypothetical protein
MEGYIMKKRLCGRIQIENAEINLLGFGLVVQGLLPSGVNVVTLDCKVEKLNGQVRADRFVFNAALKKGEMATGYLASTLTASVYDYRIDSFTMLGEPVRGVLKRGLVGWALTDN